MSEYIGYRDGGKTNEQGLKEELLQLFTPGSPLINNSTSLSVTQRGAGANMSVDVQIGDMHVNRLTNDYSYWGWTDAIVNKTLTASDPTNPRQDIVVVYVDLSIVSSVSNNNPLALKFAVVAGTPAGSPVDPTTPTIQAAVGAGNPWVKLARIAVAANAANIVNANITDLRTQIAFKGKLYGGSSNTVGHTVPNIADDTVALLNAVQTFINKTFTSPVINTPDIGGFDGWQARIGGSARVPNTVTYNGNRSYDLVVNGVDLTPYLSTGMRLKLTRTVAAPIQCTSLNGTTQYFSKASPAGMAQTDSITEMAWIKLSSYTQGGIISRNNGTTDGWKFYVNSSGQVILAGARAADDLVTSVQSVPLNRWVHVAASINTTGPTGAVYMDGISVPATYTNNANTGFAAPTQSLLVGATNGASPTDFFPGKIAQAAAFSIVVAAATIRSYISQGLLGSETSLISAYPLSTNANDIGGNGNNLTANGSATTTNADSPFTQGSVAGTIEYAVITVLAFSTNTTISVQVPEGSAIPTSGGVAAMGYSVEKVPYGFPGQRNKFRLETLLIGDSGNIAVGGFNTFLDPGYALTVPPGNWSLGSAGIATQTNSIAAATTYKIYTASSATAAGTVGELTRRTNITATITGYDTSFSGEVELPLLTVATTYRIYFYSETGGGSITYRFYNGALGNATTRLVANLLDL